MERHEEHRRVERDEAQRHDVIELIKIFGPFLVYAFGGSLLIALSMFVPEEYRWWVFGGGLFLLLIAAILYVVREIYRDRQRHQ